jgi:hypothetical protein
MVKKATDFEDLEKYREQVKQQPETPFQKIELDIIDKAIANLKGTL